MNSYSLEFGGFASRPAAGRRWPTAWTGDRGRVVLALRHVAAGFENAPLSMRLETDIETFAALVRESLEAMVADNRGYLPGSGQPVDNRQRERG